MPFIMKHRLGLSFFTGFLLHGIAFLFLFQSEPPKRPKKETRKPVQIRLIERKKEKPLVISEKEVEALKKEIKPISQKKEIKKITKKKSLEKKTKEPTKTQVQKKPKKKNLKPRKFAISMNAVVEGGTVSVPTSSSEDAFAFGSTEGDENAAKEKVVYDASDPSVISSLPVLQSQASQVEMRRLYPPEAKRQGLEANVKLRILVSAEGVVTDVEVVEKAGFGFDEVALKLAREFRFTPAQKNGESVAVWIPWTYKFRLEE